MSMIRFANHRGSLDHECPLHNVQVCIVVMRKLQIAENPLSLSETNLREKTRLFRRCTTAVSHTIKIFEQVINEKTKKNRPLVFGLKTSLYLKGIK